jgi:nucleotide-binding universal stress UspA family protein
MDQDRRVVVGVNGSLASLAALKWAVRDAGLRRARLHVVCVLNPDRKRAAPYAGHARRPAEPADGLAPDAWLNGLVRTTLGPAPEVPVDIDVVDGLAAKVLIGIAAGADLLVLGDPATSQLDVIGPVARACLRHAPCPVVVVSAEMSRAGMGQATMSDAEVSRAEVSRAEVSRPTMSRPVPA